MKAYTQAQKDEARRLYLQQHTMDEIRQKLDMPDTRTLYNWKERYEWDSLKAPLNEEQIISKRLCYLVEKKLKSTAELDEIDRLCDNLLKIAKVQAIRNGLPFGEVKPGQQAAPEYIKEESNGQLNEPGNKRSKRRKKNDISGITQEDFDAFFGDHLYEYQKLWRDNKHRRNRFILKSRQIGATYYFAMEAFEDAVLNGDNQIFVSASRDQAEVFKGYIIAFAKNAFDVTLEGSPIKLKKGGKPWAELRFVSTNARTSQGYHGHVYFDEVFWTQDWKKLKAVASGMAMHKRWRKTYFSTPSSVEHGAYPFWTGKEHNEKIKRRGKSPVEFDLSHRTLVKGVVGPDKVWRNMITVRDAEAMGCDLFDIEELELEYTEDEFNNLLMCKFIDGKSSAFKLHHLIRCAVDSAEWMDFDRNAPRPLGDWPVWIGFDPARLRDKAALVVVCPPKPGWDEYRILERTTFDNMTFQDMATEIKKFTQRYNVEHIAIDTTGLGLAVYDLVCEFFPTATPIYYSVETKNRLVVNAIGIIESHRLAYDANDKEITAAFLGVKKSVGNNGQLIYSAHRTNETGHSDDAWATMHALSCKPIHQDHAPTSSVGMAA